MFSVQPPVEKQEDEDEASGIRKPEQCDNVNCIRIIDCIEDVTDEVRAKIACSAIEVRPAKRISYIDQDRREPARRHTRGEYRKAFCFSGARFPGRILRRRIGVVQRNVRCRSGQAELFIIQSLGW